MPELITDEVVVGRIMRAIHLSVAFGCVALLSVCLALGIFVANADSKRAQICEVMQAGFDRYTDALIVATAADENDPPLSAEEQAHRDAVVADFKADTKATLSECDS